MLKEKIIITLLELAASLSLRNNRRLGRLLARCFLLFPGKTWRVTLRNLELCFPEMDEPARRELARKSLLNTFMTIFESGPVWLWTEQKISAEVLGIQGEELLKEALAAGRGVIVIGPHLGNWELMGLYLTRYGPCSQLYQPPRHEEVGRLMLQARSRAGASMVATDNSGVGALLKALKRGEMLGILPDQVPPPGSGDFAPFFGQQAFTMTLLSRLLQKTGARALLAVARREKEGFSIRFHKPDDRIYAEHMPTSLAGLNASVEAVVREIPEQYQWEYKRFKVQPEGQLSPYSA